MYAKALCGADDVGGVFGVCVHGGGKFELRITNYEGFVWGVRGKIRHTPGKKLPRRWRAYRVS